LLAFQEGLCSRELVSSKVKVISKEISLSLKKISFFPEMAYITMTSV
jgi:hypothetical protein